MKESVSLHSITETQGQSLSSGFKSLDKMIGGFKPGRLVVIGSRPSVGKTAFALSIVHNMAFVSENPVKVGFFSFELSGPVLMERIVSKHSSIGYMVLRNGLVYDNQTDKLIKSVDELYDSSSNLLIQDFPDISLSQIETQCRRMVKEDDAKIIFIDSIGKISAVNNEEKPRCEHISDIAKTLKSLAVELNVPIVALAQVYRDSGNDRTPALEDFRDGNAITGSADVVILLDDESKRIREDNVQKRLKKVEEDENETSENQSIKIIIEKNENENLGSLGMTFNRKSLSFLD